MTSVMKPITAIVFAAALAVAGAAIADTQTDAIAARQANQKRIGEISESIRKGVTDGAALAVQAPLAAELADRAHRQVQLFSLKTETIGNTKAKPEIWSNPDGFKLAETNFGAAADKLSAIAQSGDAAAFADQVKAVGATCAACHREFRNR